MVSTYTELEKLCEHIPGLKVKEEKSMFMQATMNSKLVNINLSLRSSLRGLLVCLACLVFIVCLVVRVLLAFLVCLAVLVVLLQETGVRVFLVVRLANVAFQGLCRPPRLPRL